MTSSGSCRSPAPRSRQSWPITGAPEWRPRVTSTSRISEPDSWSSVQSGRRRGPPRGGRQLQANMQQKSLLRAKLLHRFRPPPQPPQQWRSRQPSRSHRCRSRAGISRSTQRAARPWRNVRWQAFLRCLRQGECFLGPRQPRRDPEASGLFLHTGRRGVGGRHGCSLYVQQGRRSSCA